MEGKKLYIGVYSKTDGRWQHEGYDFTPTYIFSAENDEKASELALIFLKKKEEEMKKIRTEFSFCSLYSLIFEGNKAILKELSRKEDKWLMQYGEFSRDVTREMKKELSEARFRKFHFSEKLDVEICEFFRKNKGGMFATSRKRIDPLYR